MRKLCDVAFFAVVVMYVVLIKVEMDMKTYVVAHSGKILKK